MKNKLIIWIFGMILLVSFVLAAVPTHSNPVLQSDIVNKNSYADNFTLYNVSTTDSDGDMVKNIVIWKKDDQPYAILNMPFEAGSNSTYTKDYSGNNNNGIVSGASWNQTMGYDSFGSYEFNGVDNYIEILDDASFSPVNNNLTVLVWANVTNGNNNTAKYIIAKGAASNWEWGLSLQNNYVNLTLWQSDESVYSNLSYSMIVNDDAWHHYAFTINYSNEVKLFVDGYLVNSTTIVYGSMSDGLQPLQIGKKGDGSNFNGTIDDLIIYDKLLTALEIQNIYENNTNKILNTSLSANDIWQGCVTPVDNNGSVGVEKCSNRTYVNGETNFYCFYNQSTTCGSSYLKLLGAQNDSTGFTNAHAQNFSLNTYDNSLCCYAEESAVLTFNCTRNPIFNISGEDNAHAEIYDFDTIGYNETICMTKKPHNMSCLFKSVCTIDETCVLSLSNNSNGQNAHISDCTEQGWWRLCCLETNSIPNNVTLNAPPNGTNSYNRTINFSWFATTDPSGDPLTYQLNLTFSSPVDCGSDQLYDAGANLYYEVSGLCVDKVINWSVRAYDGRDYGLWSDSWNITIDSLVSVNLTTDTIEFNNMSNADINDTTDDDPTPFVIENNGNVFINVSMKADTALWNSVALNTSYFQVMADETTEIPSFNVSDSITTWKNISSVYEYDILSTFNYTDATDSAELEIKIEVPQYEIAGIKESTLTIRGVAN